MKPIPQQQQRPPLQKVYDPCNGSDDLLEIDLVGPLPPSKGYTYIVTAVAVLSRCMLAIPLRWPEAQSVVKGPMSIFTRHAYVPKKFLTDKGTAFIA